MDTESAIDAAASAPVLTTSAGIEVTHHEGRVRLVARKCGSCGMTFLPPQDCCHACGETGVITPWLLQPRGRIYAFTRVHTGRGRAVPYTLAYIDSSDDVRVLGLIDGESFIKIGSLVEAALREDAHGDGGKELVFRAVGEEGES